MSQESQDRSSAQPSLPSSHLLGSSRLLGQAGQAAHRGSSVALAWMLALSHLQRRRLQNVLTILGIAVGMMALIVALSLTNGFTRALIDATLQATPHLSLMGTRPMAPNAQLEQRLKDDARVVAFSPFVADKGLLTRPATAYHNAGVDFVTLFGLDHRAAEVLQLPPFQQQRLRELKTNEVLLGASLARNIGAFSGDKVNLLNSAQKRTQLEVKGAFDTGNYLIDSAYAFTTLETLQNIAIARRTADKTTDKTTGQDVITGYQVRLKDPHDASKAGPELSQGLDYQAFPWQSVYGTLLEQLALQKKVIAFVVFLIVVVAAFGIANVLTLIVFEKTQEIAILRAIGMTAKVITLTFVLEGLVLGFAGLVFGNILGIGLSAYFIWRPFTLPGDLYFITSLPVEIRLGDVLWVNALALGTTVLAAFIPARRAAGIEPARIIR